MKYWHFWLLSFTWGLPQTILGCIVAVFFMITGHKPHKWGYCIYFVTKAKGYSGCEFGPFFVINDGGEGCRNHEFGHGLQNCVYGPLTLFIIFIPATIRYWIRIYKMQVFHKTLGEYDDFMFEGQATRWGTKMIKKLTMK